MLKLSAQLIVAVAFVTAVPIYERAICPSIASGFDELVSAGPRAPAKAVCTYNGLKYQDFYTNPFITAPSVSKVAANMTGKDYENPSDQNGTVPYGFPPTSGSNVGLYFGDTATPIISANFVGSTITTFSFESFKFGCAYGISSTAYNISRCVLAVFGYRDGERVAAQSFSFLPTTRMSTARLATAILTDDFKNIQKIRFGTIYASSLDASGGLANAAAACPVGASTTSSVSSTTSSTSSSLVTSQSSNSTTGTLGTIISIGPTFTLPSVTISMPSSLNTTLTVPTISSILDSTISSLLPTLTSILNSSMISLEPTVTGILNTTIFSAETTSTSVLDSTTRIADFTEPTISSSDLPTLTEPTVQYVLPPFTEPTTSFSDLSTASESTTTIVMSTITLPTISEPSITVSFNESTSFSDLPIVTEPTTLSTVVLTTIIQSVTSISISIISMSTVTSSTPPAVTSSASDFNITILIDGRPPLSLNGRCGTEYHGIDFGTRCPEPQCCSIWRWCGTGGLWCATCQTDFGACFKFGNFRFKIPDNFTSTEP
ncbi:hypothetical protein SCUP515_08833 [Seiridium cupressi]